MIEINPSSDLRINPSIFKEYDIRGQYPGEIDEEIVYRIAVAFCEYLSRSKHFGTIILGHDARLSSPALAEAFGRGIQDQGRDVVDIGLATTPLFYFSVNTSKAAGGAMITASHNPPEFNGIKLMREGGISIYKKAGLPVIEKLAAHEFARKINIGSLHTEDFSGRYLDFLAREADIKRPLIVVADASNGSGGPLARNLLKRLDTKAHELFFEPDGRFPNHSPNPVLAEAQKFAKEKVMETGADLGFILDADGDRIIFIDERGDAVSGNFIYAFLLDNMLEPGDLVLTTVLGSKILFDIAKKKNAKIEKVLVGHSNIKAAMREKNARFAGELSGHYYFQDFFFSDSSLLMLVYILTFLSRSDKPFSELLKPYQEYFHSSELNFEVEDREAVIERFKKDYSDGKQSFLDGLTVEYSGWWFNIRISKTESFVRLVIEANAQELMEEKIKELSSKIK
ncbi:phosphomannomutase/phosphoglucomutase [Patescibacteria group bacterium]|nr:phosphomannomutase/phosphoglucomutase [Patescibacteria group bacterium]